MTPSAILNEARAAGVTLWVEGGALRYRGPGEALAKLLPVLRSHKPALIESLTAAGYAYPPLSPAAEARRRKVLALLARDGGQYACLVEDSNTDPVILALATPDGTCELLIPRDRYDPFRVLELVDGWNREDPLTTACEGVAGITKAQFRALLSPEDLDDIEAGDIGVETLRGYALSFAEGIGSGRIVVPDEVKA